MRQGHRFAIQVSPPGRGPPELTFTPPDLAEAEALITRQADAFVTFGFARPDVDRTIAMVRDLSRPGRLVFVLATEPIFYVATLDADGTRLEAWGPPFAQCEGPGRDAIGPLN